MATLVLSNHIASVETALLASGRPVIVAMTVEHARLRIGRQSYEVLTVSSWENFDELDALAAKVCGRVNSVATRWEGAVIAAGYLRDSLGLAGLGLDDSIAFVDKAAQKLRLKDAGIPVAKHAVVRSAAAIVDAAQRVGGWPVVAKPRRGFASTNVHMIANRHELAEMMADEVFDTAIAASEFYRGEPAFAGLTSHRDGFLIEEFIAVYREYHADGCWQDGYPLYNLPGRYHTPPLQGMGGMLGSVLLDPESDEGATVVQLAEKAAQALGMRTGFTHAEVLRTGDRWLLGEIAARPGGGGIQPAIRHGWGIDVNTLQAEDACHTPVVVNPMPRPYAVGWAGPAVPPGRIAHIATREDITGHPGVLDATIAVQVGQLGGRTGSGLWGGLAGYVFLHADTPEQVLAMMPEATERFAVRVMRAGSRP